jgi:UDP-N-acetyl-D-galactosamine dehydrogenase
MVDVIRELESFSIKVDVIDPHADSDELKHEYGFGLVPHADKNVYAAIILGVAHKEYKDLPESEFKSYLHEGKGALIDLKGLYRGKIKELNYWSM